MAELRASSLHFQNLLSNLPKRRVIDDDADERDGQQLSEPVSGNNFGTGKDELQQKLQAKLEAMRAVRNKKKTDREKIETRRKEDKKKRIHKLKESKVAKEQGKGKTEKSNSNEQSKKGFNKEGNILFSKLSVSDSVTKKNKYGLPTGRDYKTNLKKVEKQKEKLQKLEEVDKDAAKAEKKKLAWKKVLAKAEGVKVRDDEKYLKSAIKKKEKMKKKRQTEWKERGKEVQGKMQKKQEKRQSNIAKKKQSRSDAKIKRAKKRGRVVFND